MPRKQTRKYVRKGQSRQRGGSFLSGLAKFGKGVLNFLKKSKIVSALAPMLGTAFGKPGIGSTIGSAAGALGFGRGRRVFRRRLMGGALRPTGAGYRL